MAGHAKRREAAAVIKERWEDLLAEIESGKSDREACAALGLASDIGLRWLIRQDSALNADYINARKASAHALVSQTIDIGDDVQEFVLADPVRVAEMRIKSRQWAAARYNREAFGDTAKTQVSVSIGSLHLDALRKAPASQLPALEHDVIEGEIVPAAPLRLDDIL